MKLTLARVRGKKVDLGISLAYSKIMYKSLTAIIRKEDGGYLLMFKFKIRSYHIPWILIAVLPVMANAQPFQIREVLTTGSESAESFDFERGDHRETLFLSRNALITNADVEEAKLKESPFLTGAKWI